MELDKDEMRKRGFSDQKIKEWEQAIKEAKKNNRVLKVVKNNIPQGDGIEQ